MPRGLKRTSLKGVFYFSGNEAAAEGAVAAGCRFYAGYPITPSSELMERMSVRLPEVGGIFIQMEDELGSICAALGASWAGAKAMTATSGPGFSLMQEAIGYAAFTETPCVVIDVQRAGPCTGQATKVGSGDIMQAKIGFENPNTDYTDAYFSWYLLIPDQGYSKRILLKKLRLPPESNRSINISIPIKNWSPVSFNARLYVALNETVPPCKLISEDSVDWRYVPVMAEKGETVPDEIADSVAGTAGKAEFPNDSEVRK